MNRHIFFYFSLFTRHSWRQFEDTWSILTSLDAAPSPTPAVVAHIELTLSSVENDVGALSALSESFLDNETGNVRKVRWRRRRAAITTHRDRIRQRRLELGHAVALLQPVQRLELPSPILLILLLTRVPPPKVKIMEPFFSASTKSRVPAFLLWRDSLRRQQ